MGFGKRSVKYRRFFGTFIVLSKDMVGAYPSSNISMSNSLSDCLLTCASSKICSQLGLFYASTFSSSATVLCKSSEK